MNTDRSLFIIFANAKTMLQQCIHDASNPESGLNDVRNYFFNVDRFGKCIN